jgi:hypothetical protein
LTNPHSGRVALLRGPNITAARQRRPTLIGRQPEKHGFNITVNPLARPGLGRSRLTNGWQLNVTGADRAGLFHPRREQPRELDDTFHDPLARVAI